MFKLNKNAIIAIMMFAVLALSNVASASVGIRLDDVYQGEATEINLDTGGSITTNDGSKFQLPIVSAGLIPTGQGLSGSTSMADTDTAVPVTYALVRKAISSTVSLAGTLANGVPGQVLKIEITARASSGTYILRPTTATGFTTVTFDGVGDYLTLLYVSDTVGWIAIGSNSVTFSG
jgi:hypothetical protein